VYALGGMTRVDLPAAKLAGAHGIAAIRGAWIG
jgi:8-oxo-dGTP diphosphatase